MIDYTNFKINSNNMRTLAPLLLKELTETLYRLDTDTIIVVMQDLKGKETKQRLLVKQVKEGLENSKMTDLIISGCKMRFELPDLATELFTGETL